MHYQLEVLSSFFEISSTNGSIWTLTELDCEIQQHHKFNVSASSTNSFVLTAVHVDLIDVNDNAPVFSTPVHIITVDLTSQIGHVITTFSAHDMDFGSNGFVAYKLSGVDNYFQISPLLGELYVAKTLTIGQFSAVVMACDFGRIQLCSSLDLTIFVTNQTNLHPPVFDKFIYDAEIPEDFPLDSSIIDVIATDLDQDSAGLVTIEISGGNSGKHFKVVNSCLQLMLPVDYETTKHFELQLTAKDHGLPQLSAVTLVHISITDVNDNLPTFLPLPETILLRAPIPHHQRIFKVMAHDPDSSLDGNNNIVFSTNFTQTYLSLDASTGVISTSNEDLPLGSHIVHIQASNPWTNLFSRFDLTIIVKNDLTLSMAQDVQHVTLFNESHPAPFTLYNAEVSLNDSSPDEGITYSIVSHSPGLDNVTINAETVSTPFEALKRGKATPLFQ